MYYLQFHWLPPRGGSRTLRAFYSLDIIIANCGITASESANDFTLIADTPASQTPPPPLRNYREILAHQQIIRQLKWRGDVWFIAGDFSDAARVYDENSFVRKKKKQHRHVLSVDDVIQFQFILRQENICCHSLFLRGSQKLASLSLAHRVHSYAAIVCSAAAYSASVACISRPRSMCGGHKPGAVRVDLPSGTKTPNGCDPARREAAAAYQSPYLSKCHFNCQPSAIRNPITFMCREWVSW